MSTGWENHEPSPIEFMHGRLMDEFHKWRKERTDEIIVPIDGSEFNKIVVAAKLATYEKYKVLGLDKAILKSDLKCGLLPSELLRQRDELREALINMVQQYSYQGHKDGKNVWHTGGLSALEEAFSALGLSDPISFSDFEAAIKKTEG